MKFLKKNIETFIALFPILLIVLFVHLFFYQFDTKVLLNFVVAVVLVCIGESLFLMGVDSTIMPMGEFMVNSVNKASKFVVFVLFAVVFGICATIAEPDVSIFSEQVINIGIPISKTILMFVIGAGVGGGIAVGIFRIIKNINIKIIYLVLFALIFLLCTFIKNEYIAIAFDAGGATTGIITAPFLLAISNGITSKFTDNKDSNEVFGMVGLASLGPVIASLFIFAVFGDKASIVLQANSTLNVFFMVLKKASLAIIPLAFVFMLYDLLLIKLPMQKKNQFAFGLFVTFIGLFLFLFGIEFGITDMGHSIGDFIQTLTKPVITLFCVIIGFVITFCEPSVLVLSNQIQLVTKGNISKKTVIISIAISMSLAILISVLRVMYHIDYFYIIAIGYAIAILLMFVVPNVFTGIAFDSGGVASGPMTSAFLLPIMIQLALNTSNVFDGFGLVGIVAMSPIIVIQILGLVYKCELFAKQKKLQRHNLQVRYSTEMYSNIYDLEIEHKKIMEEKLNEK